MSDSNSPPRTSTRLFRFSLRSLLVLLSVATVWLAVVSNRAQSQKHAVDEVTRMGGFLGFDYQFDENVDWRKDPKLPAPVWLIDFIGKDYARTVWIVNFDEGSDPTNDDLKVVKRFGDLRQLTLMNRKQISDEGLRHLAGLTELEVLALNGTSITGSGLVHIKDARKLKGLPMSNTPLTDTGLLHVKHLDNLEWLQISSTNVTDAGLAYLSNLTALESLEIRGTAVSDEGLKHLSNLKSLKKLDLTGSKTTREGREWLQRQLPNCRISG